MRSHARLLALVVLASAVLAMLVGCGSSSPAHGPAKPLLTKDANGTPIVIPSATPQHIVSLTPADSEMLAAVGATAHVDAVDFYTDYPAAMAAKPKVSDGKSLHVNIEQIVALKPDLVLSYGGETAQDDQKLMAVHIPVVDLPIQGLAGTLTEIRLVGQLTHLESNANTLVDALQKRVDAVKAKVSHAAPVTVYMESDDTVPTKPYAAGGGTFDNDLITLAGGTNIFGANSTNSGFPQVSAESIIAANPQAIVLTEDPQYGGNPELVYVRTGWGVISAVQNKRVYELEPSYSQRPGPRLVDGLEKLTHLLHPDLA
jgi:iron complex transport system substrate-binding protein